LQVLVLFDSPSWTHIELCALHQTAICELPSSASRLFSERRDGEVRFQHLAVGRCKLWERPFQTLQSRDCGTRFV